MSASSQPDKAPSSFPMAHQLISTTAAAAADTDAGATFALDAAESPASSLSSAAAVKAAMQARRKSRGLGEGLRPDFVFPKPQTPPSSALPANGNGLHRDLKLGVPVPSTVITITSTDSSSSAVDTDKASSAPASDGDNHQLTVSLTNGSLAPPKNQQHLKTHYRTHSRNGSTVTVQDLKQAIAAVSTDLMDLPPLAVVSSITGASAGSTIPIAAGVSTALETRAGSHVFSSDASLPAISEVNPASAATDDSQPSVLEPGSQPEKSPGQGLGHVQLESAWRSSTLDSGSAPSTPLRDTFSAPLHSPSISSRSSFLGSGRTARDRSNVSVPPFFAYSIPHELPSPYTPPRLWLPGAAGPTSLPSSPFARKRKLAYHHTVLYYPTSIISVKLPGQQQEVTCDHRLPVGNVHDFEFYEYEREEEETTPEEPHSEQHSFGCAEKSTPAEDSTGPATRSAAVDKRMSWASMVSLDEDLASKPPTIAPSVPSQPYRPPNSRLRSTTEIKSSNGAAAANGHRKSAVADTQRPLRLLSPTLDEEDTPASASAAAAATGPLAPAAEILKPVANSSSRPRKAAPPPLNLAGNGSLEVKSTIGSPTTPTTPSRRRRSRSQKSRKDKSLDGTQQQDSDKETTDQPESAVLDERQQQDATGNKQSGVTDQPKKTRTRSRSRSRSRSRAHADNSSSQGSSNESVPPVPQTPSWVPAHNMTLARAGSPSANDAAPASLSASTPVIGSPSHVAPSLSAAEDPPMSPTAASAPRSPITSTAAESEMKRRGPRPARLLSTRTNNNLQTLSESGQAMFSPRSARDGPPDYFSMRPMHAPRTPMTPGGDFGDDDDDYYGRLQMVTTPMIQNGFFPNWAKGDAQLEELERIRAFLSARQYPDEMPLSDEWTLFFSDTSRAKDKSGVHDAYSSAITPLFSCHTVPQFATSWKYVRERVRPATMKVNQNLHWFKKGIKPMWEDPKNKYGGRLTICPPRALLDIVWETVLILMAGDVLDHHGEGTGAVFARRARGDRVEVWLGSDDTPEALAHIRGVLCQELAASGADELVKTAKYKKHFDSRQEKKKEASASATPGAATPTTSISSAVTTPVTNGFHGLSSPLLPMTPRMSEFQSFEAFSQHQQQQKLLRDRERERDRERDRDVLKEQERIMQLGKERFEKEKAEKDRLRDEKVRAMAAAAIAASEAKHQQQLKEQREKELQAPE